MKWLKRWMRRGRDRKLLDLQAQIEQRDRTIGVMQAEIEQLAAVIARDREWIKAEAAAYARQRAEAEGINSEQRDYESSGRR